MGHLMITKSDGNIGGFVVGHLMITTNKKRDLSKYSGAFNE